MAYICKELIGQQCIEWIAYEPSGFLPTLTTEQRDEMILWFISIFAVVFIVKAIRRLFNF